ncbi:MAG: IPT/TIG domain-containing protein [bacterium]|nr:IPT/TIG domain-containing protein [bacterium]
MKAKNNKLSEQSGFETFKLSAAKIFSKGKKYLIRQPKTISIVIAVAIIVLLSTGSYILNLQNKHITKVIPEIPAISPTATPSAAITKTPEQNSYAPVSPTLTPTSVPTTKPTSTPTPIPTLTPKISHSVNLSSVDPNSGPVEQSIVLHGSGFGGLNHVWFYKSNGENAGGGQIDSWTDTEIKTYVPFIIPGNANYQIEVESSDGSKSNRIDFAVGAPQPIIDGIDEATTGSVKTIKIRGSRFGSSQGTVNITHGMTAMQGYSITSWSDTEINVDVSGISNPYQEYGIQVKMAIGPSSSFKYMSW